MYIVHVFIDVKRNFIDDFKVATLENVRNSIKEPGIARFDFIRQRDNSSHFVLVEVYRTIEDAGKHKETTHYKKWKETVAEMMAVPRSNTRFINIHPNEKGWD